MSQIKSSDSNSWMYTGTDDMNQAQEAVSRTLMQFFNATQQRVRTLEGRYRQMEAENVELMNQMAVMNSVRVRMERGISDSFGKNSKLIQELQDAHERMNVLNQANEKLKRIHHTFVHAFNEGAEDTSMAEPAIPSTNYDMYRCQPPQHYSSQPSPRTSSTLVNSFPGLQHHHTPLQYPAAAQPQENTPMTGNRSAENRQRGVERGIAFFEKVQSQCDLETFRSFLKIIKRLNNQQTSKDETIVEVTKLFEDEHHDLVPEYVDMISYHGSEVGDHNNQYRTSRDKELTGECM
jgi:histone deacetylase complex regulatory component SIN3